MGIDLGKGQHVIGGGWVPFMFYCYFLFKSYRTQFTIIGWSVGFSAEMVW